MAAEAAEERELPEQQSSGDLEPGDDGMFTVPDDQDEEEPKLTRAEKKRLRYDEARREADEARAEAQRERQVREDYERRLAAIEMERQREVEKQGDPYVTEIARLEKEERDLYQRKPQTKEEADELGNKAFALRRRQNELIAERAARSAQQPQQQYNPFQQAMMARYPEVFSDRRAYHWAVSRENMLMAEHGQGTNPQIVEQALREARERYFPSDENRRRDVSEGDRSRYSGTSRGASGGGGAQQTRKLTKQEYRMAVALRPDLSPADASKHFLKTVKNKKS